MIHRLKPWLTLATAAIIIIFGFAPFHWWWLTPVTLAYLIFELNRQAHKGQNLFWLGWWFGLWFFGFGVSWVYSAMRTVETPVVISIFLTGLFCLGLALLFGLQFWLWQRFWRTRRFAGLSFMALWLLFEWLRQWLFTGLPWLYLGYAHDESWLSGWVPIIGVYGASALVLLTALALDQAWQVRQQKAKWSGILLLASLPWFTGLGLKNIDWTQGLGVEANIGLVQGNTDQLDKWDPQYLNQLAATHARLTAELEQADLIIWPETAIPAREIQLRNFLAQQEDLALARQQGLLVGLVSSANPQDPYGDYLNSVFAYGLASGQYHKEHLVPFGEYLPLDSVLRGLIDFFDLPMSDFVPGPSGQNNLRWQFANQEWPLGLLICYEVAYTNLARRLPPDLPFFITVSNDAWFGTSIGPHQHLQIAKMRALELQRPMARATQTGISVITDHRGRVVMQMPSFEQVSDYGMLEFRSGSTPYQQLGYWWILLLALGALVLALILPARAQGKSS